jgi:hypothetical protein
MSLKDIVAVIGKTGDLYTGDLHVEVKILDVRQHHGQTDYEVTPIAGYGQQWVLSTRVTVHETATATATVVPAVR